MPLFSFQPSIRLLSTQRCLMLALIFTVVLLVDGFTMEKGTSSRVKRQGIPIPADVLARLKGVRRMQEIHTKINVLPSHTVIESGLPNSDRINAGSFVANANNILPNNRNTPSFSGGPAANRVETGNHSVIEDPEQGQDSCKLFSHCQPLPFKREVGYYYFPQCVDLPVCTGGCCDTSHTCHASSAQVVRVKVSAYRYLGNTDFNLDKQFYVSMERHLACSCQSCPSTAPCRPNEELQGCICVCKYQDDNGNCQGVESEIYEAVPPK